MSYTALYRKWRPMAFEEVKGQEHIVTTLKNQIKADRIGHAYLFCGTRGTGKTTVAKILAKAVNCENPQDGSPCGECNSCKSIAAGTSMNVIEIDAASNNGVDNIREIREEVAYSPSEGKYKVYIIDEVHMLSIGAFNALLKTLEEPPAYVIFILATTESHKIPITILSRCQRYDFKRISIETIAARLSHLMQEEQIEVEEKAVRYVAKAADGSMRDALTLLDQCLAFYMGQKLTYDNVLEVLGAVDTEVFSEMLGAVLDRDTVKVLHKLEELVMQGRDLGQFVTDFIWHLRNLLLIKTSDNMEDVLDVSRESLERMMQEAERLESDQVIRYIRIFSEVSNQLKYASQKRILLEVALIKLCKPEMEIKTDSLLDRIRSLEQKVAEGVPVAAAQTASAVPSPAQPIAPVEKPVLTAAIPEDIKKVVQDFRNITMQASGLLKSYLKNAKLSLGNNNQLLIVVKDIIAKEFISADAHKQELKDLIGQHTGKAVEIEVRLLEGPQSFETQYVDIEKIIHMELTIEE